MDVPISDGKIDDKYMILKKIINQSQNKIVDSNANISSIINIPSNLIDKINIKSNQKKASKKIIYPIDKLQNVKLTNIHINTTGNTNTIGNTNTNVKNTYIDLEKLREYKEEIKNIQLSDSLGNKKIATIILQHRSNSTDANRLDNFHFIIKWINRYFKDIFDIIVVEQDSESRDNIKGITERETNIRYYFLYNPYDFNRGWGFNCAVKNYIQQNTIIIFSDTDILFNHNILKNVLECYYDNYAVISPYKYIHFTKLYEKQLIKRDVVHRISLEKILHKSHPVTLCGGIVIMKRATFMRLGGFEQYYTHGCEDRALDVMCYSLIGNEGIHISPDIYYHMFHKSGKMAGNERNSNVLQHLRKNYRCGITANRNIAHNIHKFCRHTSREKLEALRNHRIKYIGDVNLYKTGKFSFNANTIPKYKS